jgi:type VI secretion system protein ImpK
MQALNSPEIARTWTQFRRFYGELAAAEREIASSGTNPAGAEHADGGDQIGLARSVFTRLHRTLGELGFGSGRSGGGAGIDAGYVMASLADEALLHRIDWFGRASWDTMLLEDALYGTRIAGERIFIVAEEQARGGVAFQPELALAILLALQLGFRGCYRGGDDEGALPRLRLRLYELICHRPSNLELQWRDGFASAYGPTLGEDRVAHLPPLRPWLTAIAAVAVVLLLVTHGTWHSAVHSVVKQAEQVIDESSTIRELHE